MIPEIDPKVQQNDSNQQSAIKPAADVKDVLDTILDKFVNPVTPFTMTPALRDMLARQGLVQYGERAEQVTTNVAPDQRQVEKEAVRFWEMMEYVQQSRDRRLEWDIRLLDALHKFGAITVISPYLSDSNIVVNLPSRFERAMEVRTAREKERKEASERAMAQAIEAMQLSPREPFVVVKEKDGE